MDLNEYQQFALRTANKDATRKERATIAALGLTGESGEFADMIKKHIGQGHDLDRLKAMLELGDVLWYIAEAADALGFTLNQVAIENIDKLQRRYPEGFNAEASKARVDAKGEPTPEQIAAWADEVSAYERVFAEPKTLPILCAACLETPIDCECDL